MVMLLLVLPGEQEAAFSPASSSLAHALNGRGEAGNRAPASAKFYLE
jgi:hypothetical protein